MLSKPFVTENIHSFDFIIITFRVAFDEDRVPNLYDDQHVIQDIHSVPSLLKMYFRELPNPICTYHLYDKFVEAAKSSDDQRLGMNKNLSPFMSLGFTLCIIRAET